jgi:hypothetical protein
MLAGSLAAGCPFASALTDQLASGWCDVTSGPHGEPSRDRRTVARAYWLSDTGQRSLQECGQDAASGMRRANRAARCPMQPASLESLRAMPAGSAPTAWWRRSVQYAGISWLERCGGPAQYLEESQRPGYAAGVW